MEIMFKIIQISLLPVHTNKTITYMSTVHVYTRNFVDIAKI